MFLLLSVNNEGRVTYSAGDLVREQGILSMACISIVQSANSVLSKIWSEIRELALSTPQHAHSLCTQPQS